MKHISLLCLTLLLLALPLLAQEPHTGFAKPDTLGNPDLLWLKKGGAVLGFFPDGQSFLSTGTGGTYKVWRTSDGELLNTFPIGVSPYALPVMSADASLVVEGGSTGIVVVVDTHTGEIVRSIEASTGLIGAVAFSADHSKVLSVEYGGQSGAKVRLWDVQSGAMVKEYGPITVESYIYAAEISPDGQYVAVGTTDGRVYIWNLESGSEVKFIAGPNNLARIHFSHDGKYMAAQGTLSPGNYGIQLWRTSDWRLVHTLESPGNQIHDCAFTPGDKFLVSGGDDGLRVWDVSTGENIYGYTIIYQGLPIGFTTVAISPDSSRIVSCPTAGLYMWQAHWSPASSVPQENDPTAIDMHILPNPAGGSAVLEFTLPHALPSSVHAIIEDIQGREILSVSEQLMSSGLQHISLNTVTLANGQYFCTVHINNNHYTLPFTIQH